MMKQVGSLSKFHTRWVTQLMKGRLTILDSCTAPVERGESTQHKRTALALPVVHQPVAA
jgi:hypothetical protein